MLRITEEEGGEMRRLMGRIEEEGALGARAVSYTFRFSGAIQPALHDRTDMPLSCVDDRDYTQLIPYCSPRL